MDEKLKRVVYYIRVSTEEQKIHGLSLDAQRMKLDEYAQAHNFVYVGTYADEGISGRKPIKKRPQLQKMLQDAQKNMFDLIIFIKLDRYFRSVAEYHACQKAEASLRPFLFALSLTRAQSPKYRLHNDPVPSCCQIPIRNPPP